MDIITNRYRKETGKCAYKFNFFGCRKHNQEYIDWLEKQCNIHNVIVPLCECGGNERVALDCTSKPCKHLKYCK